MHDPIHEPGETGPDRLDPDFVFDFGYDDLDPDTQRWSTWRSVTPLCRGPEPRPDWVVTDEAAIDTELGVLKTGKEGDVHLIERAVPGGPGTLLAAKRYRDPGHRSFHRSAVYTEGWSTRRSRDARAIKAKSTFGRELAATQWANAEWEALKRLWSAGVPVPYPVQIDGTEILMELIGTAEGPAPRLAQTRPDPARLADWFDQVRDAMTMLARDGIAHGDLSPYNILADGERLVIIDLPQAIDLIGNGQGMDLLMRDCTNVATWFRKRGLSPEIADEHALFADLVAAAL